LHREGEREEAVHKSQYPNEIMTKSSKIISSCYDQTKVYSLYVLPCLQDQLKKGTKILNKPQNNNSCQFC